MVKEFFFRHLPNYNGLLLLLQTSSETVVLFQNSQFSIMIRYFSINGPSVQLS